MKNVFRNIIPLFMLIVVCVFIFICITSTDDIKYTNDVKDYNSEEYPVPNTIFPVAIPKNVQVKKYLHCDFWYEAKDIYLEIQFNSVEEMNNYLIELKADCISNIQKKVTSKIGDYFIETENDYDKTYKELFCTIYTTSTANKEITGYTIEEKEDGIIIIKCNFGVISYSYENLTVIHSLVYGWYNSEVHNYVPLYFKRFKIPLQDEHKRIINLE